MPSWGPDLVNKLILFYRIYLKVDEQISFFFKIYIGWFVHVVPETSFVVNKDNSVRQQTISNRYSDRGDLRLIFGGKKRTTVHEKGDNL
jgi:hypothetical protein